MVEAQPFAGPPPRKKRTMRPLPPHPEPALLEVTSLRGRALESSDANFPNALLGISLLAGIFPAAQLTFYLDMCAFGQRLSEF
jgi:hypothetical protein